MLDHTTRCAARNDVVRAKIAPLDAHDRAEIDALLDRIADRMHVAPLRATP